MKTVKINKKNGFSILAVILVIVAVIVAIGAWALSGQANTSNSGDSASELLASSIVNDSSAIKLQYDTMTINGTDAGSITFAQGVPSDTNMISPTSGFSMPTPPSKAMSESYPNTYWTYNKNFVINGLGSNGQNEYVIMLGGIKDSVCKKINKNLHNDETIVAIPQINDVNGFMTGATSSVPVSTANVDWTQGGAPVNTLSWTYGCVKGANTVDGNNVFFRVLKIN